MHLRSATYIINENYLYGDNIEDIEFCLDN